MSLEQLIRERDLLVCVGPGGVGKTTVSAAIGLAAARLGRNTLVLTIDPAKRLADALGLSGLDDEIQEVPTSVLERDGGVRGRLYAAMLDTGASFDALMRRVMPSEERAEAILNNRVYRAMAGTLARSHAYVAMERLYEVMGSDTYDLVVLDTPPTRSALDIFDAPNTLVSFLEENVVKWFVRRKGASGLRARLRQTGGAAAQKLFGLIAGEDFLSETIAFFEGIYDLRDGFRERAEHVRVALRAPSSGFVLITSADSANLEDAQALLDGIDGRGVALAGAVFNRAYEPMTADITAVLTEPPTLELASLLDGSEASQRLAAGVHELTRDTAAYNARRMGRIDTFMEGLPEACRRAVVATLDRDIRDVAGLDQLGVFLAG